MSGVGHSREHPFFFEWRDYEAGDADERMSAQLVKHWTQMAKTGRPASETAWPGVTSENVPYIELGPERLPDGAADEHCGFWDTVELLSPHL